MAIVIPLTKTKSITLALPRWLDGGIILRYTTIVLTLGIILFTAWVLFANVTIPLLAPQPLKPEEITAERAEIDQTTLNAILLKNQEKRELLPIDASRDPFQP